MAVEYTLASGTVPISYGNNFTEAVMDKIIELSAGVITNKTGPFPDEEGYYGDAYYADVNGFNCVLKLQPADMSYSYVYFVPNKEYTGYAPSTYLGDYEAYGDLKISVGKIGDFMLSLFFEIAQTETPYIISIMKCTCSNDENITALAMDGELDAAKVEPYVLRNNEFVQMGQTKQYILPVDYIGSSAEYVLVPVLTACTGTTQTEPSTHINTGIIQFGGKYLLCVLNKGNSGVAVNVTPGVEYHINGVPVKTGFSRIYVAVESPYKTTKLSFP